MMPSPTVVVRGTGSIGMRHLRVFRDAMPDAKVVAFPTRPHREVEGFETVHDWDAVAKLSPLAIVVATDTALHIEDTHRALDIGAHVLIEKPVSPTIDGLGSLAEHARASKRQIRVGCNMRFSRSLLEFRRKLPEIGHLHAVRVECASFLPDWRPGTDYRTGYAARADEGGVLRDLVHEIDYCVWMFGAPSRLSARLQNTGRLGIASEEQAELFWGAPDGAMISIYLDYLSRPTRRGIVARGEHGILEWDAVGATVSHSLVGKECEKETLLQERDAMMADQARAFVRLCRADETSQIATLDDAALSVAICDTARLSSAAGHSLEIVDWKTA